MFVWQSADRRDIAIFVFKEKKGLCNCLSVLEEILLKMVDTYRKEFAPLSLELTAFEKADKNKRCIVMCINLP